MTYQNQNQQGGYDPQPRKNTYMWRGKEGAEYTASSESITLTEFINRARESGVVGDQKFNFMLWPNDKFMKSGINPRTNRPFRSPTHVLKICPERPQENVPYPDPNSTHQGQQQQYQPVPPQSQPPAPQNPQGYPAPAQNTGQSQYASQPASAQNVPPQTPPVDPLISRINAKMGTETIDQRTLGPDPY